MKTRIVLLLLLTCLTFADNLLACPQTETGVPACAYWTRADAVFSGKVLEINVLDHIIVTQFGFYSFADEGLI